MVFAALLWWSWRRWPDPLVDFGRELYVPWRINAGQVLYRDLASLFGPLSPVRQRSVVPAVRHVAADAGALQRRHLCGDGCRHLSSGAPLDGPSHGDRRWSGSRCCFSVFCSTSTWATTTSSRRIRTRRHTVSRSAWPVLSCSTTRLARRSRRACAAAGVCFGLDPADQTGDRRRCGRRRPRRVAGDATQSAAADRREPAVSVPLFITMAAVPPFLFFLYFATQMETPAALARDCWSVGAAVRDRHYEQHVLSLEHGHRHTSGECRHGCCWCSPRASRSSVLPSPFRGRVPTERRGHSAGDSCA